MSETRLTRPQLQSLLNVDEAFLVQLESESIVTCDTEGCYTEETIERVRLCQTIHDDLGVNMAGIEIILHLLDLIRAERAQFKEVLGWLKGRLEQE